MPMTIYKAYAGTVGDSVANFDIQLDGVITAMLMSLRVNGVTALNEGGQCELSFLSTNSFAANDVRGSLMIVQSNAGLLTSGMLQTGMNIDISSLEVPVNAGERVHMHTQLYGSASGLEAHAYLYIADKGTQRVPGRRR